MPPLDISRHSCNYSNVGVQSLAFCVCSSCVCWPNASTRKWLPTMIVMFLWPEDSIVACRRVAARQAYVIYYPVIGNRDADGRLVVHGLPKLLMLDILCSYLMLKLCWALSWTWITQCRSAINILSFVGQALHRQHRPLGTNKMLTTMKSMATCIQCVSSL